MNERILDGPLARRLMEPGLNLKEATHEHWPAGEEPNTFVGGMEPIDAIYYTNDLEVTAVLQLSFHEWPGDHRLGAVDVTTRSACGSQQFKLVRPQCRQFSTRHHNSTVRYLDLARVEEEMMIHRLQNRLDKCDAALQEYPGAQEYCGERSALTSK